MQYAVFVHSFWLSHVFLLPFREKGSYNEGQNCLDTSVK